MNIFDTLINRGAEYAIAREERKEAALLPPASVTPNEDVVMQTPSRAVIENGKIAGTESAAQSFFQQHKPLIYGLGGAILTGLVVSLAVSAIRGGKRR